MALTERGEAEAARVAARAVSGSAMRAHVDPVAGRRADIGPAAPIAATALGGSLTVGAAEDGRLYARLRCGTGTVLWARMLRTRFTCASVRSGAHIAGARRVRTQQSNDFGNLFGLLL